MKTISIDLHGMNSLQAKKQILQKLKSCPANISEIEVIHGFNGGQTLLNMVRSLSHPRIKRKILGMNNGVTILELK